MTEDQVYDVINAIDRITEAVWAINKRLTEVETAIRTSC